MDEEFISSDEDYNFSSFEIEQIVENKEEEVCNMSRPLVVGKKMNLPKQEDPFLKDLTARLQLKQRQKKLDESIEHINECLPKSSPTPPAPIKAKLNDKPVTPTHEGFTRNFNKLNFSYGNVSKVSVNQKDKLNKESPKKEKEASPKKTLSPTKSAVELKSRKFLELPLVRRSVSPKEPTELARRVNYSADNTTITSTSIINANTNNKVRSIKSPINVFSLKKTDVKPDEVLKPQVAAVNKENLYALPKRDSTIPTKQELLINQSIGTCLKAKIAEPVTNSFPHSPLKLEAKRSQELKFKSTKVFAAPPPLISFNLAKTSLRTADETKTNNNVDKSNSSSPKFEKPASPTAKKPDSITTVRPKELIHAKPAAKSLATDNEPKPVIYKPKYATTGTNTEIISDRCFDF